MERRPVHDLPLTIRENPRARRVLIKLVPRTGLVVVVPQGFDTSQVTSILAEKQDWIVRTRERMEAEGVRFSRSAELPDTLDFPVVERQWQVLYLPKPGNLRLTTNATRLIVSGPQHAPHAVQDALARFVARQAKEHLPPLLHAVSERLGLPFESVRIRTQKSRWGSCSARKTISLNCKLLFLPPELVEHLMIHELCHTRHMNHSPQYWQLVRQFQPQCHHLEKRLGSALSLVPDWMP